MSRGRNSSSLAPQVKRIGLADIDPSKFKNPLWPQAEDASRARVRRTFADEG